MRDRRNEKPAHHRSARRIDEAYFENQKASLWKSYLGKPHSQPGIRLVGVNKMAAADINCPAARSFSLDVSKNLRFTAGRGIEASREKER